MLQTALTSEPFDEYYTITMIAVIAVSSVHGSMQTAPVGPVGMPPDRETLGFVDPLPDVATTEMSS